MVSRLVRVQEASGSNPDTPTKNEDCPSGRSSFFFWCLCRDSKDRPERSEGKKQSGGLFLRSWENPFLSERIPLGCRLKGILFVVQNPITTLRPKLREWLTPFPQFFRRAGFEEGKSAAGCVKKCLVETIFARGRIHCTIDAPLVGVDMEQSRAITETLSLHSGQKSGDHIYRHRIFCSGFDSKNCLRKTNTSA